VRQAAEACRIFCNGHVHSLKQALAWRNSRRENLPVSSESRTRDTQCTADVRWGFYRRSRCLLLLALVIYAPMVCVRLVQVLYIKLGRNHLAVPVQRCYIINALQRSCCPCCGELEVEGTGRIDYDLLGSISGIATPPLTLGRSVLVNELLERMACTPQRARRLIPRGSCRTQRLLEYALLLKPHVATARRRRQEETFIHTRPGEWQSPTSPVLYFA
jgi:hypothetical protein